MLEQATQFLQARDENHWATWLADCATRLRRQEIAGIEHLLDAYGGMGSFNDLMLHPINGHRIDESDVDEVNERLQAIRTSLYALAQEIQREAVIRDRCEPSGEREPPIGQDFKS
ncbi:MAG: DUF6966 domain-containing protein [Bacteroidota bacterium]